jgi:hypothetical protein
VRWLVKGVLRIDIKIAVVHFELDWLSLRSVVSQVSTKLKPESLAVAVYFAFGL